MTELKAIGSHIFMGAMGLGFKDRFTFKEQFEVFDLGRLTAEHNLGVTVKRRDIVEEDSSPWHDLVEDRECNVLFGNPRCTGFSLLTHGCGAGHGANAHQTIDIRQFMNFSKFLDPDVIVFESVQQAGTTGAPLIKEMLERYGEEYRLMEVYHNAAQFGSAQHRARVVFIFYKKHLKVPVFEITEKHNKCTDGKHYTVIEELSKQDMWNTPVREYKDPPFPDSKEEFVEGKDYTDDSTFKKILYQHHCSDFKWNKAYYGLFEELMEGESFNNLPDEAFLKTKYLDLFHARMNGKSLSFHCPRKLWRDGASPVVFSSSWGYIHPEHLRPLSVRELCTLMGLPSDWLILGSNDAASQVGKGLCGHVADWVGDLVYETITNPRRRNDTGIKHEQIRVDTEDWVPKRPRNPNRLRKQGHEMHREMNKELGL